MEKTIGQERQELAVIVKNFFEKLKKFGSSETFRLKGSTRIDNLGYITISWNKTGDIGESSEGLTDSQMECFKSAIALLKSDKTKTSEAIDLLSSEFFLYIEQGLGQDKNYKSDKMREFRQTLKDNGLKKVEVWVKPELENEVKKFDESGKFKAKTGPKPKK